MFDDEAAVDLGRDPDDLEVLIEGNYDDRANEENENEIGEGDENQENTEGNQPDPEGTPAQPKKRVVKRPQPKLDPERLKGPRGIATLEHVFKDFKFRGKGHEKDDLNRMMKQLEHWAHRLYPRFQFDDCLEKIEKLGHKKPVGTLVKRIRMGLETGDEPVVREGDEDDDGPADKVPDFGADANESPLDAFDALLSQQLSEARARTPLLPAQPSPVNQVVTEEQVKRMMRNRQLAEERRMARSIAQQDRSTLLEDKGNSSGHEQSSEVTAVIERVVDDNQQAVMSAFRSLDCLNQENVPQHNPESDIDVHGTDNLNHSSPSDLEQERNTGGVFTVDNRTNNERSQLTHLEENRNGDSGNSSDLKLHEE